MGRMAPAPERVVTFRPRTVLTVAGILISLAIVLWVAWVARRVLVWTLIAVFLALALNPAVDGLQRRGLQRRGAAAAVVYVVAVLALVGLLALFVPTLVQQVDDLVQAAPGYVRDLTHGRGPFGFLETKYHIVDRLEHTVSQGGGTKLLGGASAALDVTRSIVTFITAAVTIAFLTFFMLLYGPEMLDRGFALLPAHSRPRWRHVAQEVYRTVGGYVTGNLFISVIAGGATTLVLLLLGIPFAVALGVLVAVLDLIPLAGATLAAIVVTLVALTQSLTDAVIVVVFFIVYQQVENHLLQPLVYGRTVKLSPLVILVSVLIGAEVAGIVGALSAIPIAGSIQIVLADLLQHRRPPAEPPSGEEASADGGAGVAPTKPVAP
jgi:predicted PurR-regulated permease PerM